MKALHYIAEIPKWVWSLLIAIIETVLSELRHKKGK